MCDDERLTRGFHLAEVLVHARLECALEYRDHSHECGDLRGVSRADARWLPARTTKSIDRRGEATPTRKNGGTSCAIRDSGTATICSVIGNVSVPPWTT